MPWEQGALSCPRKGVTSPLQWPRALWTHAFSHFFSDSLLWARRLGWGQEPGLLAQNRGIQPLLSNPGGWGGVCAGTAGGGALLQGCWGSQGWSSGPRGFPEQLISLQRAQQWTTQSTVHAGSWRPGWLPARPRGSSGSFRGPSGQSRETGRQERKEGREEARGSEDAQDKHETQADVNLYLEKSNRATSSGWGQGHQRVLEAGARPQRGRASGEGGHRCRRGAAKTEGRRGESRAARRAGDPPTAHLRG